MDYDIRVGFDLMERCIGYAVHITPVALEYFIAMSL